MKDCKLVGGKKKIVVKDFYKAATLTILNMGKSIRVP